MAKSLYRLGFVLSLPGLLISTGILQITIALIVYAMGIDRTRSLELWIMGAIASTGFTFLLAIPRLKRNHQALETLIATRTTALMKANAQLAQEIEERKQIEVALRLRETTLKKVQQIAHIGSWEFNFQTRQITWSEELYRIHGLDPKQPQPNYQESLAFVHPDDLPIHQAQIYEPVINRKPFAADLRIIRADGTVRFLEARGEPIFDENHQLIRYLGMTRDLTERKEAEEKLRQSEATNRALVQAIPDLLIRIHRDGTYLDVFYGGNVRVFNLEKAQIDKHINDVLPLETASELMQAIQEVLATKQIKVDERQVVFNQRIYYEETRIVPCTDDEVLVIVRDISDRKQIELELEQARAEALQALAQEKELNRLKSEFVSLVTHDFHAPLVSIQGFNSLLRQGCPNLPIETQNRYFNKIDASVNHLMYLLEQVLLIGKSESGKLQCYPTTVNLEEFCRELIESFQLQSNDNPIEFSYTSDRTSVEIDETIVRQIMINLLTNAAKYSPQSSAINLTVECEESAIVLQVQDRGIGIPPEEQTHLFEAFYRCSNVKSVRGSGLGLAVVKTCVDAHNGEISIISQIGQGTTVTVTLPTKPTK
ncbi:ATP-binding protein [Floridanema aerugineum]|uniref:histidine kinase n=1 Tax=Floridaenema aerugineum BLCC-F46 TaxID=3153654 RepID=A0ABV4X3J0_9CYAN